MAVIVPTVDSVGDAALTNSIIDRSITELQDNLVEELAEYALNRCTNLKKVAFGMAASVGVGAIYGCSALEVADFHQTVTINKNAFKNCTALVGLILRSRTVCTLADNNALQETPITSGTGYIYVPAALVDSYKAASGWSTYANQIRAIEDYPEVCSTAGKVWAKSNATSTASGQIAYGNGRFVGVIGDYIHYSDDGLTWTTTNLKRASYLIFYANGLFFACNSSSVNNYIYCSNDGVNWTQGSVYSAFMACVSYGNGLYVECDNKGLRYSDDGITWTASDMKSRAYDCIYANGLWVAATAYGLYYSTDGKAWTQSNITATAYKVYYAEGLFVAGTGGSLCYSEDGMNWTPGSGGKCGNLGSIVYADGRWVCSYGNSGAGLYYSDDGKTWISTTPNVKTYEIVYAGIFVACTESGIYYSYDGAEWMLSNVTAKARYICVGDGVLVSSISSPSGIYYSE